MLFPVILSLPLFWTYAAAQTPSASSTAPTPTCLQPRKTSDPLPSAISAVLASAVPKACDPELQELVATDAHSIRTYEVQSFHLNISRDATPTNQTAFPSSTSSCTDAFQDIISTCIESPVDAGFWGGWIILESLNYSISDFAYPESALVSASSVASIPATSNTLGLPTAPGQTGNGSSASAIVSQGTPLENPSTLPGSTGDSALSGQPQTATNDASDGSPTRTLTGDQSGPSGTTANDQPSSSVEPSVTSGQNDPSATATDGASDGSPIGTITSDQSGSSGTTANDGPSGSLHPSVTSGQSDPSATAATSALNGSLGPTLTGQSNETLGGPLPGTSNPGGTAPTGSAGSQDSSTLPSTADGPGPSAEQSASQFPVNTPSNSAANSSTFRGESSALGSAGPGSATSTGNGFSSVQTSGNGISTQDGGSTTAGAPILPTGSTSGAQDTASQSNGGISQGSQNPGGPSSSGSQGVSSPSPSNANPDPTNPGGNTITPPPVIISTTSIDRDSPQATSNGFIIGGLLSDLSKSAKSYSNEITIPATKTAFLDDIDDTEHQLETLFKNMGGTLPPDTGGCSGGARKQRRAIGDLIGDVFNTVRCAINSVDTLKSHVDIPEPDFPTIEGDLDQIGSLSENIDNNTENDNDGDDSSTKEDQQSTTQSSTTLTSTNEETTTDPSSTGTSSSTAS
ncbi:MAG: hypothetical protein Q9211_004828, partial [Gyalolechia sp. 1 TL-2023]